MSATVESVVADHSSYHVTLAGTRMVSRVPEPKLGGFNATEQGLGDNISMHSVQHWML